MNKDYQERIDTYLHGEMTANQRYLFESELEENEELRKEYWLTQSIVKALANRNRKLDLMKQWSEELKNEQNINSVVGLYPYKRQRQGIAYIPPSKSGAYNNLWKNKVPSNGERHNNIYAACTEPQINVKRATGIAKTKFRIRKWIFEAVIVACMVIGIYVVKSVFFVSSPSNGNYIMPDFGSGILYNAHNSDILLIDSLIAGNQYAIALSSVDSLVNETIEQLKAYEEKDSLTEKDIYNVELNRANLYELEWRQIHLLLALNKKEEAIPLLLRFSSQDGMYKYEADSLLKTLKVRSY